MKTSPINRRTWIVALFTACLIELHTAAPLPVPGKSTERDAAQGQERRPFWGSDFNDVMVDAQGNPIKNENPPPDGFFDALPPDRRALDMPYDTDIESKRLNMPYDTDVESKSMNMPYDTDVDEKGLIGPSH
mmetsp:Transcript_140970/g.199702  ORF Transcript_140970/g.199702 Transcript_140970/m.199702 type:complete len:132 (+) Transcript_140970:104-499(+)